MLVERVNSLTNIGYVVIDSMTRLYEVWEVEEWFGAEATMDVGRKRVQVADRDKGKWLASILENACKEAGVLGKRRFKGEGIYGLRNVSGAQPQDAHTDYAYNKICHLLGDCELVPLSAIWAASTEFELIDYSNNAVVLVPAGKVAVFRADWWHGGGKALSAHLRVHGYGVSSGVGIPTGTFR